MPVGWPGTREDNGHGLEIDCTKKRKNRGKTGRQNPNRTDDSQIPHFHVASVAVTGHCVVTCSRHLPGTFSLAADYRKLL